MRGSSLRILKCISPVDSTVYAERPVPEIQQDYNHWQAIGGTLKGRCGYNTAPDGL